MSLWNPSRRSIVMKRDKAQERILDTSLLTTSNEEIQNDDNAQALLEWTWFFTSCTPNQMFCRFVDVSQINNDTCVNEVLFS